MAEKRQTTADAVTEFLKAAEEFKAAVRAAVDEAFNKYVFRKGDDV